MKDIRKLLKDFQDGKIVVVFDDVKRENEADLITAIDRLTAEKVNFLITYGKGLLCAALSDEIIDKKGFPFMPALNKVPHSTAFTLSVDSKKVKTGISPYERYLTAIDLIDKNKNFQDFITPGHLFPLAAKKGLLLERRGHTEAAVSLCKWADLPQGALICEMINDSGEMYSREEAMEFARLHNLGFCDIEDLVEYQNLKFPNIEKTSTAKLTTEYGVFDITVYREMFSDKEHVFLSKGNFTKGIVRIHSECFTGDVLASKTCDCRSQLHFALKKISDEGSGALVYLRQEGRGIGLGEKIKAYQLQQKKGLDTVEANLKLGHKVDNRDYHCAAWILKDQGFKEVRLLTNNPDKEEGLKEHGLKVTIENFNVEVKPENYNYLLTKKQKMGHKIVL